MTTARVLVAVAGAAVAAYGASLLLGLGVGNLVATVTWLAGAVLVHDGLVGPALVLAGGGLGLAVRGPARAPVAAGLVVLGTVTATALPVLGRFGARPDNPTLLDRPYLLGWAAFATLVAAAVLVGVVRVRRRASRAAAEEA